MIMRGPRAAGKTMSATVGVEEIDGASTSGSGDGPGGLSIGKKAQNWDKLARETNEEM